MQKPTNNKEVSAFIAAHLTQQRARSVEETTLVNHCRYRGESGSMCAVGCLIDDVSYKTRIESCCSGDAEVVEVLVKSLGFEPNKRLLAQWQGYHDGVSLKSKPGIEDDPEWLFSYGNWLDGDEAHHPEKFMAQLAKEGWDA